MKPAALAYVLFALVFSASLGVTSGSLAAEIRCRCLARVVCQQRPNCRDPSMRRCLTCKSTTDCANWDVSLDFKTGNITIAAYSGCFIGTFKSTPTGAGTIIDAKLPHYQFCNARRAGKGKNNFKIYFNRRSYRYVLLEGGEGVDYGQCLRSLK